MKANRRLWLVSFFLAASAVVFLARPLEAASLSGRILLQVQDKGQAWYVDPVSAKRYYLGRPDDAYTLMRSFGLGVSNRDLASFLSSKAPSRLSGRIILQVQDRGQAYYIDPATLKLHYLGRPQDAYNVIRSLGLGITDQDLARLPIGWLPAAKQAEAAAPVLEANWEEKNYSFKYQNVSQGISLMLSPSLYRSYQQAPKVYTYPADNPPADLTSAFYGVFLAAKSSDSSIADIIQRLRSLADRNAWTDDQLLEAAIAFIQYVPYDQAKADSHVNNPYYPYETLYLDRGICSDKVFLGVAILRKLGYGAAILDFDEINHSALGISCPVEYSLAGSGYCYAETTNYFPIGVIPNSINGQAKSGDYNFAGLFDESKLGKIAISSKTSGKIYQGAAAVRQKVSSLSDKYAALQAAKEAGLSGYDSIIAYNKLVNAFNQELRDFYQQ